MDPPLPDSAAAGSAWGSGERIFNGRINVDVQGRALTPLNTLAKRAGKKMGLVTTARITHATPASFAANQESRNDEDEIAPQYLERDVDVLLGGGHRHFAPDHREDGQDLYARYAAAGYAIARDRATLAQLPASGKLLGVFSDSHIPYAIDRTNDTSLGARTPGLKAMTQAALARLADAPKGFILQIESGRVDHAGHANDPGAILAEMLEFDALIAEVRAFAAKSPETLVIVTTDHGTGGFMVNGEGAGYAESTERFLHLGGTRTSFEGLAQRHRTSPQSASTVAANLGLPAEAAFLDPLAAALDTWDGRDVRPFGRTVRELLAPWYATSWTTQNHTGELVEFAAFGPGSHTFGPFFENWEVHHRVRELMGI